MNSEVKVRLSYHSATTDSSKKLLFGRITLDQFCDRNRFLQAPGEIKGMTTPSDLSEEGRSSAEGLTNEARDLTDARNTVTFRSLKGVPVDHHYQSALPLSVVAEW